MLGTLAAQRQRRLAELCNSNSWDCLLLYGNVWRNDFIRYAADFATLEGHAFCFFDPSEGITLMVESEAEAERARAECPDLDVVLAPDIFAAVNARLEGLSNRRLAVAPRPLMPRGVRMSGDPAPADRELVALLAIKLEAEIDATRRAAVLADEGYEVFRQVCRPGVAEYEVVAAVEEFLRQRNCPDNFMIIGSGGPEVRGMHPPGERRLQAGDMVTTELTPCVDGYYAQLCRTLVVGEPSADQLAAFDIFHEAFSAGLAAVRPGVTAGEIARLENDVFRAHGLGAYTTSEYTRVRGHGLGIYLDTPPAILEDVQMPLVENMTLIVHPNTYHPVVGYLVFGDSMVVRADGPEVLTTTPRKLFSVGA